MACWSAATTPDRGDAWASPTESARIRQTRWPEQPRGPRPQKKLENSTAHTSDIASECDQSIKSSENPGLTPGVTVTCSMPSITKMPNSTSRNPYAQQQRPRWAPAAGSLLWRAPPRNDPRTLTLSPHAIEPRQYGHRQRKADQAQQAEIENWSLERSQILRNTLRRYIQKRMSQ